MSQYPLILLPQLLTEMTPPTHSKPVKPVTPSPPRKPYPLPSAPQPVNIQRFIISSLIATVISLMLGGMISLFNASLGGGMGIFLLLASLGFIFLQMLGEKASFNGRLRQYEDLQRSFLHQFEHYSQQLAQYEQAQQSYPTMLQSYEEALLLWQQEVDQFRVILSSQLNQSQPYETLEIKPKQSYAEQRFEAVLNKYFPSLIKTGVKVQNSQDESDNNYIPDFVYLDDKINFYIDIEVDEPYNPKTHEPTHYLGAESEQIRQDFFLENLWVIIRFSEEQVVISPQICCKVIADVINQITGDDTALSLLQNESDLSPIKRWNYEEAVAMEQQNYRKTYLK